MARKSMVLLKNEGDILPLDRNKINRIAIVGPNADDEQTLLANYFGTPSEIITPLKSLKRRLQGKTAIDYMKGVDHVSLLEAAPSFETIAAQAKNADVILFFSGINANYEGEQGDAGADGYVGFASGDRTSIQLPSVQLDLLKALKQTGRPIILVNMSGSVMSFEWESQHVDAILQAWYGGQAAGDAITDILFGDYNPAGRMPLTTYMNDADLPPFEDYAMQNRTYRYFRGQVRYPFGYGLSYTTFQYSPCTVDSIVQTGQTVQFTARVTNSGERDGEEVVQLYIAHTGEHHAPRPICALKGFQRIALKKGESREVTFTLSPEELALVNQDGMLIEQAGKADVYIGGGLPYHSEGIFYPLTILGDKYQVY